MEKIYRVQMNNKGEPDYSTAKEMQTKSIKYFDEEEYVWKIGEVVEERKNEQIEMPEFAEWRKAYDRMTDCSWK